ncbi:OpgC domain-containing protein [Grimontia kaedaensis]|uniref:OpgC domain-containing protein n=1 Tax=Grimontia kaedaensis TaxID=2872157 RepID=A0ABY4X0F6_9GAMM|nr:OpgC domain-containing protein [Grimontia kaedaensis]USH04743.1 OpgC domain-containing protein [Grimontia kaedaensis]
MKRIPALDSLRGLLLVLMAINHLIWLSGCRSLLQYFTLQPLGQFGAAEGFVMISCLLAGAVYSRAELLEREATNKVLRRAFTIYKYHMVSLLLVMVWFSYCAFALPTVAQSLGNSFNNLGEALPSGFYGIMAYQDVDGNNTLSFGANGIPSEGFGFSNNPAQQGPPSMALIRLTHHEAQDQIIHLLNLY